MCAVQFKAVCDGLRAHAPTVTIEGDSVKLTPTVGAFITMNPGYLGRSELPEGLKSLFRPITVMVPDLTLICENMLMAEGFVEARTLASKFFSLYSLCRELLSKQQHYDWGLRAIKVRAGGVEVGAVGCGNCRGCVAINPIADCRRCRLTLITRATRARKREASASPYSDSPTQLPQPSHCSPCSSSRAA